MKHKGLALLALGLAALMATVGILNAAPTQYEMEWWGVDGGGGTLSDGIYSLSGTVGQPDVSPALKGGTYRLVGGYWYGVGAEYRIYLPLVLKAFP